MRPRATFTGGARPLAHAPFRARLPLMLCACLFVCAPPVQTAAGHQRGASEVSGTVHDEHGDLVTGASVTAFNNATGVERQTTTNEEGFFSILFLPPGSYSIVVRRDGFKTAEVSDVAVGPGEHVRDRKSVV